jgi:hypothetical protein
MQLCQFLTRLLGPGQASLKCAFDALSEEPEPTRTPALNALLMYINKVRPFMKRLALSMTFSMPSDHRLT